MKKSILKTNNLMNYIYLSFINLPTPLNINIMWNFGSMLGLCLIIQILSGLFLSMHYTPNIYYAFNSIIHIMQDVNLGWLIRFIHLNGASMFFICMFIHIGRNLYYYSFFLKKPWFMGVSIFLLSMMTAFLGYVLPWGQMSYWGATVITNLISAIPYLGMMLIEWMWGGFSINNATLNRFYSFHFILPLIILFMVMLHLIFLHEYGSSNSLGINSNYMKIPFHSYYSLKDYIGFMFLIFLLMFICLLNPYIMSDPENFNMANSMITPIHIQPEWYFLFAYAILRSIPNKLGGVIALLMSIIILFFLPYLNIYKFNSNKFYFLTKILYFMFLMNFMILTWIGSKPIEYPFMFMGQISSSFYFLFFFIFPLLNKIQDFYMYNNYIIKMHILNFI